MDNQEVIQNLNGFGSRLNTFETEQGRHDERIKSNTQGEKSLWDAVDEVRKNVDDIKDKLNEHALDVSQKINKGIKHGIVIVGVPTLLVLYQMITAANVAASAAAAIPKP